MSSERLRLRGILAPIRAEIVAQRGLDDVRGSRVLGDAKGAPRLDAVHVRERGVVDHGAARRLGGRPRHRHDVRSADVAADAAAVPAAAVHAAAVAAAADVAADTGPIPRAAALAAAQRARLDSEGCRSAAPGGQWRCQACGRRLPCAESHLHSATGGAEDSCEAFVGASAAVATLSPRTQLIRCEKHGRRRIHLAGDAQGGYLEGMAGVCVHVKTIPGYDGQLR
mmetsp:Transcript_21034/g.60806  ORF Transcript_21034/g.60806 Transcript_21034/m.60806 type:complete len:225 (-) Transcript_21034:269-943(-)